jgi:hypothetical protein
MASSCETHLPDHLGSPDHPLDNIHLWEVSCGRDKVREEVLYRDDRDMDTVVPEKETAQ